MRPRPHFPRARSRRRCASGPVIGQVTASFVFWSAALKPGQIVIADNLSSHKSARAIEFLRAQGNDLIFLPPYSPDLNPIEMAFSKLKTLIRKAAARTYQALWTCVGAVCDLFPSQECTNYFKAAGYGLD